MTVYQLSKHLEGRVSKNTLHAAARGEVGGVQFETLAAIMDGVWALSGRPVAPDEVLEVTSGDAHDLEAERARQRALALLTGDPWGKKPQGSKVPAQVKGPPTEELLREHRGPAL